MSTPLKKEQETRVFPIKICVLPNKICVFPTKQEKDTTMRVHATPETLASMSSKKPKTEIPVPINKEPRTPAEFPKDQK